MQWLRCLLAALVVGVSASPALAGADRRDGPRSLRFEPASPSSPSPDCLTPGVFLLSRGFTFCPATSGSQYAEVHAAGNALAPGQTTIVPLLFVAFDPSLTLSYTSHLLGGLPYR